MKQVLQPKTLLAAAVITAGLGVTALGVGTTFAAQGNGPDNGRLSSLVDAIATHFNVSHDEVQAIFDEHHETMAAERQAKQAERLAQAVEDGKVTQEQADAISAKMEEMHTFQETLTDLTPEERRDAMKEKADEMRTWAQENDIPMPFAGEPGFGRGGDMRHGGGGGEPGMGHHERVSEK